MVSARGDGDHTTAQPYHVYGRALGLSGAIAQSTIKVHPPALDTAGASDSTGVVDSHRYRVHAAAQPHHTHGYDPLAPAAIAQLTVAVITPTLDTTCAGEGTGVGSTRSNGDHAAAQPHNIYRCTLVDPAAIAQLTKPVPTPALDAVICAKETGVRPARGYGGHAAA